MNTRRYLCPSLLACVVLAAAACVPAKGPGLGGAVAGSGNVKSEGRDIGPFEAISIEYPADVTIQQGEENRVEIQAEDNLLPQISTEVISGKLAIKTTEADWNARVNPSKPVRVAITMKNPKEIEFSAPVGTLMVNGIQAGTLKLVLSGAGQVKLTEIQVDLLDTVLSGAGDIQATGAADEIQIALSGWGDFSAADLRAKKATVDLSGAGDVIVHVEQELAATIKGAGSVKYYGNPRIEQSISGAGSIRPAE